MNFSINPYLLILGHTQLKLCREFSKGTIHIAVDRVKGIKKEYRSTQGPETMRSCFLGLKGGEKEWYFWGPWRTQAVEEELPDRSCSQRGLSHCQKRGAEQEQAGKKYPHLFSHPLISCLYPPLAVPGPNEPR